MMTKLRRCNLAQHTQCNTAVQTVETDKDKTGTVQFSTAHTVVVLRHNWNGQLVTTATLWHVESHAVMPDIEELKRRCTVLSPKVIHKNAVKRIFYYVHLQIEIHKISMVLTKQK